VHHVRKGQTEDDELSKFSFRGAAAIIDQPDNAIILQRNKKKEREFADGNFNPIKDAQVGDSILRIVKQRFTSWEGVVHLWFDPARMAFCRDAGRRPELAEKKL
jgi:hypothetical protein